MILNILKKSIKFIKNIYYTCFTSFPYYVYEQGNNKGNFGLAGVGLGLIRCNQFFWISNIFMCLIIYFKNNNKLYYFNIFLSLTCSVIYSITFIKSNYLMNFLL